MQFLHGDLRVLPLHLHFPVFQRVSWVMSVPTARKVMWKKYKVAVPQDTCRQTSSPALGECMLSYAFQTGGWKHSAMCVCFYLLHLMQAAFLNFVHIN